MADRFKSREEYDAWKATGGEASPARSEPRPVVEAATTNRTILGFRVASGLNVLAAVLIFIQAKSAVHEIEALMCLLIAAVFSVGSTIASGLQRLGQVRVFVVTTVLLGSVGIATADRIYLKHGDYVETDSWREEGDHLFYRQGGGEIGILSGLFEGILDRIRNTGAFHYNPAEMRGCPE